jgi:hypothetical protein
MAESEYASPAGVEKTDFYPAWYLPSNDSSKTNFTKEEQKAPFFTILSRDIGTFVRYNESNTNRSLDSTSQL